MSQNNIENFISNHFIKIIVSCTVLAVAATWAVFTFSLGERVNIANAKLDAALTKNSEYEAQIAELTKQVKSAGMKPNPATNTAKEQNTSTDNQSFTIKKGGLHIDKATGIFIAYEYKIYSEAKTRLGFPNGTNKTINLALGEFYKIEFNNKTYTLVPTEIKDEEATYLINEVK